MSDDQRLIFIGGVHGAGKTTLSCRVAEILGAEHVTAGDLIKAAAIPAGTSAIRIVDKAVANVDANQERLLRGLYSYCAQLQSAKAQPCGLLLDGHFCLLDPMEHATKIPFHVFDKLRPVAILLIETDPETVAHRLIARDGSAPSIEALRALTEQECAHAASVAKRLHAPMYRTAGDGDLENTARVAATYLHPHLVRKVA